ncbi:flagellar biosynthesis protein FlhF [Gammaproteobacteria bacterium 42_54_T18]|nr:flagellar biosynthesis protein FlhF [Gammaproteobacteria bacterium 42_54_T18]
MKAKKFVAPDMRQALKLVRETMGSDAVILSNRKVAGGVEVSVALDYEQAMVDHKHNERQKSHIPDYTDGNTQFSPVQGDANRVLKETLAAVKDSERRDEMRTLLSQQRQQLDAGGHSEFVGSYRRDGVSISPAAQQKSQADKLMPPAEKRRELAASDIDNCDSQDRRDAYERNTRRQEKESFAAMKPEENRRLSFFEEYEARAESEAMQQQPPQHQHQQAERQQSNEQYRAQQYNIEERSVQEHSTQEYVTNVDNAPHQQQPQNYLQQERVEGRPSHEDRRLAFEEPQKVSKEPAVSSEPQALPAESTQDMHQMRDELQQLRSMINSQLGNVAWGDFSYRHPVSAAIFKRLVKMGLSSTLSRSLSQQVDSQASKKDAWHKVLVDLSSRIPVFDSVPKKEGRIAFIGPAGVGKTTTIAKLAAEYVLAHGPENLALVTTDSYRIAGHEQLRVLSKILKVPLRVVAGNQSLESALRGLSRKKMVLIDTAGLSHKDCAWEEQISQLTSATTPIQKWLVLSATSQQRILDKAVMDYKSLGLDGCVLTKLDESASLGEALNVAIEHQLSVAYTTNGQNIPDDIEQAKSRNLLNQAIALTKQATIDDELAADCFNESIRTDNGEFTAA